MRGYYQAYYDFAKEYRYDALGISCWPKIQKDTLACPIIAKLNQNGIAAACEGDLPSAVSMLLLQYLAQAPAALMDMTAFDENDQTILMWHCGPAAECYADDMGVQLTYSEQPDAAGRVARLGLINDLVFKPQHLTFMRITGEWDSMLLLDGKAFGKEKPSPAGSRGWIGGLRLNRKKIDVIDFVNTIFVQGFQHHYPMVAGDITEELMETAAWLGLTHVPAVVYENYLQTQGDLL